MSTDATIRSLYRIHIDMLGVYRRCHQACRRLRILPTVIPTPTCMAKRSLARAILLGYIDVDPERRSPRYHETCLALESIKEGSAAVSKPRGVWLRVHIFKDLEKARRLPVRVEEQQAQ